MAKDPEVTNGDVQITDDDVRMMRRVLQKAASNLALDAAGAADPTTAQALRDLVERCDVIGAWFEFAKDFVRAAPIRRALRRAPFPRTRPEEAYTVAELAQAAAEEIGRLRTIIEQADGILATSACSLVGCVGPDGEPSAKRCPKCRARRKLATSVFQITDGKNKSTD